MATGLALTAYSNGYLIRCNICRCYVQTTYAPSNLDDFNEPSCWGCAMIQTQQLEIPF